MATSLVGAAAPVARSRSSSTAPDLYQGAVVYILPHVAQQVLCAAVANARASSATRSRPSSMPPRPAAAVTPSPGSTPSNALALADAYRVGFPRGAEDQIYPVSIALNGVVPGLVDFDPGYFDDFWTEPGYGGSSESLRTARIRSTHTVKHVLTAAEVVASPAVDDMDPYQYLAVAGIARTRPDMPVGVVVDGLSADAAVGAWLTVTSGAASGRELISLGGGGDVIVAAGGRRNMSVGFEDVEPGDEVAIDNSHYLAYTHFTRHQHEDYPEFAAFTVDGAPIYPQRLSATGSPDLYLVAPYRGAFDAKCIVVQNLHDGQCWPCGAQNLRRLLVERRGIRPGPARVVHRTRDAPAGIGATARTASGRDHSADRLRRARAAGHPRRHRLGGARLRATGRHRVRHHRRRRHRVARRSVGAVRNPAGRARHRKRQRRAPTSLSARSSYSLPTSPLRRAAARSSPSNGISTAAAPGRLLKTASTAPGRRWSFARAHSWTTPARTSRPSGSRPTATAMPTRCSDGWSASVASRVVVSDS